jgi:hypothetical protein
LQNDLIRAPPPTSAEDLSAPPNGGHARGCQQDPNLAAARSAGNLEFAGELIDCQVVDLAPGSCRELLNRTGHDPLLSAASVAFNSGGLINWSANQRAGHRMRGLELDSTLVTERFPTEERGPVTDQRRCATG